MESQQNTKPQWYVRNSYPIDLASNVSRLGEILFRFQHGSCTMGSNFDYGRIVARLSHFCEES
jgi:hypothetical protein